MNLRLGQGSETFPSQGECWEQSPAESDMVLTRRHQEKSPMSQPSPTEVEQRPADLKALHRQLEEIAKKANQADRPDRDRHGHPEGPMIVVRGK
jgi:hypothetical protein